MTARTQILKLLADGAFHSGAEIGSRLGISRAAVGKNIRSLATLGLELHAVHGRGYRLAVPSVPLERDAILRHLGEQGAGWRERLTLLERVDSTNRYLLARPEEIEHVCLAEVQSAGRGRRGKAWVATPYHNVVLSMAWRFAGGPGLVSGLSLAAGVAVLRALEDYGVAGAGLKWPNDVLWQERKLAGLLVEVQGEAAAPCRVVLGVGVNGYIAPADAARIDQPWVDLYRITGAIPDRNRLVARLVLRLHEMFETFAARGLEAFRVPWERRHLYTGRTVRLVQGGRGLHGVVEGIDELGALRVRDSAGRVRRFLSGEISLRPA